MPSVTPLRANGSAGTRAAGAALASRGQHDQHEERDDAPPADPAWQRQPKLMPADPILGWRLDPEDRAALLERFPPRYPTVVADHVTFGRASQSPVMPVHRSARVIGRADDGTGVEALVVELGGDASRWDGGTYHMTWSLAEGRTMKESNEVIAARGWEPIEGGPKFAIEAAEWR